jgi:hypothetical protein
LFTESAWTAAPSSHSDAELSAAPEGSLHRSRIVMCDTHHPRRLEAEAFVRNGFARTHGAVIQTFMPSLLMLTDATAQPLGVTGSRGAGSGALFLERYLDRPIEDLLAATTGARVRRSEVVEVGNFACRDARVARRFISLLPRHLIENDFVWITFTATISIRRILRYLGARCVDLGPATGACARGGPDEWGRYYTNDPRVMAGYLPLARRIPALWVLAHGN